MRDRHEPDRHDRPEQRRDFRRAARLERKQHDQDDDGQRHHEVVECRRGDVDAFDGGQDRQRRRNDGVAVEQRRADDAEQRDDAGGLADAPDRARSERHQRERAALAVVVGAQQDQHVFQRDDDDQRPQDQRHDAEHASARESSWLSDRKQRPPLRAAHRAGWCRCRHRRHRCCRARGPTSRRGNERRRCRPTGTSLPTGALTLSVMKFETGPRPAPDAASERMQGRAYTPSAAWSHGHQRSSLEFCHNRRKTPPGRPRCCTLLVGA